MAPASKMIAKLDKTSFCKHFALQLTPKIININKMPEKKPPGCDKPNNPKRIPALIELLYVSFENLLNLEQRIRNKRNNNKHMFLPTNGLNICTAGK